MNFEEFSKFGCIQCGGHDFLHPIGEDVYQCATCNRNYPTEYVGELDGDLWLQARAEQTGETYEPPRTVRYHDDAQFVDNFVENVENKEEAEAVT